MADPYSVDIEVISDVICPWCFIGTRRLQQALASMPEVSANVMMRPYFLDPTTPSEGQDLRERLRAKYGGDPDQMFGRVEEAARSSGIPLDFSKIRRTVPTLKAHTLLRVALTRKTQPAFSDALFSAYFLEGKDVSDTHILSQIAQTYGGFTDQDVKTLLSSQQALTQTRLEAKAAAELGIGGVPFFMFNDRVVVSGAESVERFQAAIQASRAT
jgi:predicted DsbA family dithiol-disulfide isomerase